VIVVAPLTPRLGSVQKPQSTPNRAQRRRIAKVGRNETCPCGSGKRFKQCHGMNGKVAFKSSGGVPPEILAKLKEVEAVEARRTKQQGHAQPFVAFVGPDGTRFVGVGLTVYYSKNWKTVPDFLAHFIKKVIGEEWGNAELKKPYEDRHPILLWYDAVCRLQQQDIKVKGQVYDSPMTGAVAAYYSLAYGLCLLQHNSKPDVREKLIPKLIARLKNKDQFFSAYYETMIMAAFMKAGFVLEPLEHLNLADRKVEFVAHAQRSGRKYSVEVKARNVDPKTGVSDENQKHVVHKLSDALGKPADHERIVFIELNSPNSVVPGEVPEYFRAAIDAMRAKESTLQVGGKPAPPAIVILTNHPFHYHLNDPAPVSGAMIEGFKIPDIKYDVPSTLRDAIIERKRNADVYHLLESFASIDRIPNTYEGETSAEAFYGYKPTLTLGEKVEMDDGTVGVVTEALVVEAEKKLILALYDEAKDAAWLYERPMTDVEWSAYSEHPDTFFGRVKPVSKNHNDPIKFYEWILKNYQRTPKERLLEFLKDSPNIEKLATLSQRELAEEYALRVTGSIVAHTSNRKQS